MYVIGCKCVYFSPAQSLMRTASRFTSPRGNSVPSYFDVMKHDMKGALKRIFHINVCSYIFFCSLLNIFVKVNKRGILYLL